MIRRPDLPWRRAVTAGLLVLAALVCGAAPPRAGTGSDRWDQRLAELEPGRPMAYFELAEDIADAAETPQEEQLARHLFALAGVLDRDHLGRSACLALADMEEDEAHRRRLLALAALVGGGGIAQPTLADGTTTPGSELTATTILALTDAFSYYRRGRGTKALTALEKGNAQRLLEECERFLRGGLNRFLEDCRNYRGQLRPTLTERDLVRMLRLEVALLAGADRSWSSDLLFGRGQPLLEVDPTRLAEMLGVNAACCVYRDGQWVEPGS